MTKPEQPTLRAACRLPDHLRKMEVGSSVTIQTLTSPRTKSLLQLALYAYHSKRSYKRMSQDVHALSFQCFIYLSHSRSTFPNSRLDHFAPDQRNKVKSVTLSRERLKFYNSSSRSTFLHFHLDCLAPAPRTSQGMSQDVQGSRSTFCPPSCLEITTCVSYQV